ncbi:LAFE_0G05380g1_1 [Lachancea fermentati]|uniref:glycogenin glucosyltransferase n=1 Tax=Lachancea fermentati TaxID=4955 RepID=A0A1G4MH67_LACFM|nr:LAFE_0G05380g1_1 [Lachancea fermentati]
MVNGIVTLLYSRNYLPGVFTVGFQLQEIVTDKSQWSTCVLISDRLLREDLRENEIEVLDRLYDEVISVDLMKIEDSWVERNRENLALLERPELAFTFLKLELWKLVQFQQLLYLDTDVLILNPGFLSILDLTSGQTVDQIGAVPDCGWPDMFNTGVMSIVPSNRIYSELVSFVSNTTSIDGADQGILNQFFNPNCQLQNGTKDWIRLPFLFNVTVPNAGYQSTPAIRFFENEIKLVHFIGKHKPWLGNSNDQFRNKWWSYYFKFLQKYYSVEDYDVSDALKRLSTGDITHFEEPDYATNKSSVTENSTDSDSQPNPNEDCDAACEYDHEDQQHSDKGKHSDTELTSNQNFDVLSSAASEVLDKSQIEVVDEYAWDATKEPPPKDGKPEASTINLDAEFEWNHSDVLVDDHLPHVEAIPKPIFPWEVDRDLSEVQRVFPDNVDGTKIQS